MPRYTKHICIVCSNVSISPLCPFFCFRRNGETVPPLTKGPDTAESVASGPQSINSAPSPSIKTETPSSHKSETSGAKTGPSTRDTAESGASASKPSAASPAASLQGFLLSDSSPKSAEVGGGGGGASTLSSPRAPASFPPAIAPQQPKEEGDDQKVNLDGALSAPRYKPAAAAVPHKAAGKVKVEGAAATTLASGLAAKSSRVGEGAAGAQKLADGDWGGVSEGMFRKRVSDDLKAMLRRCGGRCEMKWVKDVYEKQNKTVFNLQGKKVSSAFDWFEIGCSRSADAVAPQSCSTMDK